MKECCGRYSTLGRQEDLAEELTGHLCLSAR